MEALVIESPPSLSSRPAPSSNRGVDDAVDTMPAPVEQWLASLLDELDYGLILLRDATCIVRLNRAAHAELVTGRSVSVADGHLRACCAHDTAKLVDAMHGAAFGGLRRLVTLGAGGNTVSVAMIPLAVAEPGKAGPTMAVFGRRRLCERISVQWFARANGLTPAESRVLEQLCEGLDPRSIAAANGVGMATVRTHVSKIREKTGAPGIRGLIQQLALLPPIVSILRC